MTNFKGLLPIPTSRIYLGTSIDLLAHHSLLLATTNQEIRILTLLRIGRIESLSRIAKVAKVMPRLFGTVKASSCVWHLSDELSKKGEHYQPPVIEWKTSDKIIFCVIILSLVLSFIIPMTMGMDLRHLIHDIVRILSP